jgi:Rieske Fe-S protein
VTSANDDMCDIGINRRVFVAGAGSTVMGLGLLTAACGASGGTATPGNPTAPASANGGATPTSAEAATPTAGAGPSSTAAAKPAVKRGAPLGKAAAVPVGGGAVFAAHKVVVTQPQAGRYVGLSAVCTHAGCIVGNVAGGTINCPCHGSRYHLDGTVARGPAARALANRPVAVVDGELELG